MNRKLATAVAAGVAAIGSATISLAATGVAGASTPPAATATKPAAHPALRTWLHNHRRQVARQVVVVSAGAIHITPSALVAELKSGKTIADVANEHGVNPQTVISALVTRGDATITKMADNGTLTATRASKLTAALPHWVAKLVAHQFGHHAGSNATAPAA